MKDLWPSDLKSTELAPPVLIIQDQGAILAERTKGRLRGRVEQAQAEANQFAFEFQIEAPTIGYTYVLFRITYGIDFYPIQIYPDEAIKKEISHGGMRYVQADTEDEFVEILSKILSATKTRRLISALLLQIEHKSR